MSVSEKKRKELRKAMKKRADRPRPVAVATRSMEMKHRDRVRYTNKHAKDLFAMESAIVNFFLENRSLDDADVAHALTSSVFGTEVTRELSIGLAERLDDLYAVRFEPTPATKAIWADGMRTIYTSIKKRSSGCDGDRDYLNYAVEFIGNARF